MSAAAFRAAILAALPEANLPEMVEPDRLHRFTNGRRGDRSAWCKLFADLRAGVYGCWRQGISETWTIINRESMTSAERADLARQVAQAAAERKARQVEQWTANAGRIAALYDRSVPPLPGDPVGLYLKHRGFTNWPPSPALRMVRSLSYWHDGEMIGNLPAMVAPVQTPDGRTVAMHCTFLTHDGKKATVPGAVKKLTPAAGPLTGACIRLSSPLSGVIGIAEGIETALAASLASGVPTVAAYCAGALAGWQWPASVRRLLIFADADNAGREAADALRARALSARLRAEVLEPTTEGTDWADVWAAREEVCQ